MKPFYFLFKWLDLKNNPLELSLKQAAGDCLNEAQCKKVKFYLLFELLGLHSEFYDWKSNVAKKLFL